MRCPLHGPDNDPSASAHPEKGWYCQVCEEGGTLASLVRTLRNLERTAPDEKAAYDPFEDMGGDTVVDFDTAKAGRSSGDQDRERLNEGKVLGWHERLAGDSALLGHFCDKRGLTLETLARFAIGYDSGRKRYTIPIRDSSGTLVNVRRYRLDEGRGQKVLNSPGHGSPPRLYPLEELAHDTVWVVEGELDALVAIQHGFHAVTGTGGAKKWDDRWSQHFAGKDVIVCYDNDEPGQLGAKKVARSLGRHADTVTVLPAIVEEEGGDLTDFFLAGGTAADLERLVAKTPATETPASALKAPDPSTIEPVSVKVIGSMDSRTNGKPLSMAATITGKKNPTYSVPRRALLMCTMNAGPRCKACPMATDWEGEHTTTVEPTDVATLAKFIDVRSSAVLEVLREHIGAQKCNRLTYDSLEQQTIEEIYVMGSVDTQREGENEGADYTARRVYNVGRHDTETNAAAILHGTTTPSPKTQRNEFFAWRMEEAVTSIDSFRMSPELMAELAVFRPAKGQSPIDKCREIAVDLSANVTKIVGRERLHMAMDLVWHSLLHFPLDGKTISRGWLELLVVGDTRTGKSETALRLCEHYGLGHVIGCEGATFAGLIGGVKEVGDSRVVSWGEITLNDRRLCVLDEASGLHEELIAQMSDVRSRGIAQITKIETSVTRARCRLVWISNARQSRFVDDKRKDGIDIVSGLIGNPEDIARFDFAMSVSTGDVRSRIINSPERPEVPHVYTSELCRNLILWAWSRTSEHVVWRADAYKQVYRLAEKLGGIFTERPPLVQAQNVREKIARLAVALAARTFSTDATGEKVVVTKEHVNDAAAFLHRLYSYDAFGYLRASNRHHRNEKTARKNKATIKKWLREHPRLQEFLIDRTGSFRSQDLEEMAHMLREEVNMALGKLSETKMISKDKSQIIIEPTLHDILKELEDET